MPVSKTVVHALHCVVKLLQCVVWHLERQCYKFLTWPVGDGEKTPELSLFFQGVPPKTHQFRVYSFCLSFDWDFKLSLLVRLSSQSRSGFPFRAD